MHPRKPGKKALQKELPLWKVAQGDVEKLMGSRLKHLNNDL
jgi:hypothetical protein